MGGGERMQPGGRPPPDGAAAAATAAAAAGPPEPGAAAAAAAAGPASQPWAYLRLEYISERQTRRLLFAQRVVGLVAWAALALLIAAQFNEDSNSLMRSHTLEVTNMAVASCCLAVLLPTAVWYARRLAAARAAGSAAWGHGRKFLLLATATDLVLHLVNLGVYLASNILSFLRQCGWYSRGDDILFLLSYSCWCTVSRAPVYGSRWQCSGAAAAAPGGNRAHPDPWPRPLALACPLQLFFLNLSRPLVMLPPGSWRRLRERWTRRGRLGRWLAACCCCCGGGSAADARLPTSSSSSIAGQDVEKQQAGAQLPDAGTRRRRRWLWVAHGVLFCMLWVPTEALIIVSTLGSLGCFGAEPLFVCESQTSCEASVGMREAADAFNLDWATCQSWNWCVRMGRHHATHAWPRRCPVFTACSPPAALCRPPANRRPPTSCPAPCFLGTAAWIPCLRPLP